MGEDVKLVTGLPIYIVALIFSEREKSCINFDMRISEMTENLYKSLFREGQKVTLYISKEDKPYTVTIESLSEEGLEISAPLMKGYFIPIETGSFVKIEVGNRNGLYKLPFRIVERGSGKIVNTLKLKPEGEHDKMQRRKMMRMDMFVDFDLEFPYGGVYKQPSGFLTLSGRRGNLSGSGLFFHANKPLPVDFRLNVRLNLEPHFSRDVIAQARVVRVVEDPLRENHYGIAIEFLSIREADRDRIISYVLHKERDIIRRELDY